MNAKRILFFDTETTGLVDFRAPVDAPTQPRLVQLAALLTDNLGAEIASVKLLVNPRQFEIPAEASAIHGITTEYAREFGVPLLHALFAFTALAKVSERYVCHNYDYDSVVVGGECSRMSFEMPARERFCTMEAMTNVCRIKRDGKWAKPQGDFKWPKLQEAYQHCFQKTFDRAHDAMADVRACKEIYFWLKKQNGGQS